MKQFKSCQELIEFLIEHYDHPQLGDYMLNDDEVEIYGGMLPHLSTYIISPKYPRTLFILQAQPDVNNLIHFGIILREGCPDMLPCVSLPAKYFDELYLTMNNQV